MKPSAVSIGASWRVWIDARTVTPSAGRPGKPRRVHRLARSSRFKPLPCAGTCFQLLDYSGVSKEKDADIALRLIEDHGVASIPVSAFNYQDAGGPVLRFCFAKREETLRAAAERLVKV